MILVFSLHLSCCELENEGIAVRKLNWDGWMDGWISGLSSFFLETRVGRFGSTFYDAPPGHSV